VSGPGLLERLARAYGPPPISARLRSTPEDFQVEEVLGFRPAGHGGHAWLWLEKRGLNTAQVAARIADLVGVRPGDIGYSGLKDRHALTRQWFSVSLEGRAEPDWSRLQDPGLHVLEIVRNHRKLRRGTHRANHFRLLLRDAAGNPAAVADRLAVIGTRGVPNYFAEQRFGRAEQNLEIARAMLLEGRSVRDRHHRGLYLSAARSAVFNRVLSARVAAETWDRALPGEVLMLDGTHSLFLAESPDEALAARVRDGDVHPTGPLWGLGGRRPTGPALEAESRALSGWEDWCGALEHAGLQQERRALRLLPRELTWDRGKDGLALGFALPAGAYATAVLRELLAAPAVAAD
jgi:tRNA pseudouridine13 synthase